MTSVNTKINFSNDLGYGSVKALIGNHSYIVPSTAALLRQQDVFQPITFQNSNELNDYINDFINHLDVSIQSPQVQETRRMFIGKNAITSRLHKDNFNVNNFKGKAETDLALILTLSIIGGEAIKDVYNDLSARKKQKLTEYPYDDIHVTVDMTTALPVTEGKKPGMIEKYADRFYNKGNEHIVTFHNFEKLITVHVTFTHPTIALEGETALYKIRHANPSLAKLIANDFIKAYPEYKDKIDKSDPTLLTARPNAIVIDIGEGTTDFAVFTNGKINEHASSSLKLGFGNVLESAVNELQQNGINVKDRADLQQQLNEPEDIFNINQLRVKKDAVNHQLEPFEKAITKSFGEALNTAGSNIEIIYVLGGGATPMDKLSNLRQSLINETKAQTGGIGIFVVFIDPRYAQLLNEAGLQLINQAIYGQEGDE